MSDASEGTGGLTFDKSKRSWPNELNVFGALILIIVIFEILGAIFMQQSLLFDTNDRFDSIFNEARLRIIIIQVAIIGIIALGVTQVIITAGIDLSSGSVVGATAMIAMSFAQVAEVNGAMNPKAIFGPSFLDLPVVIPIIVGLTVGTLAGAINGLLVAYARIPPFIATLGMMPVIIFLSLAVLFHFIMNYTVYGKHTYAIGSNEAAARMSGINVPRHLMLVYMIAGGLAGLAAVILTSKNLTAQSGMGLSYELEAIAMAVIGGVSLFGGRGSIIGTVIGALIIGVITSGFTFLRLGAFYQEMVLGCIIVGAVALDQWQQQRAAARA